MKDASLDSQRHRSFGSQIEPLEARIAPASIITVNTLGNVSSSTKTTLAAAIATADAATGPTTIDFAHGLSGVITLTSTLSITGNVTINGAGITLSGAGKVQDLYISGGGSVTLNGLRITGGVTPFGSMGGGVYINDAGGSVTLASCLVYGNHAIGQNGNAGSTTNNSGTGGYNAFGGGIGIAAGNVTIQSSIITGNVAIGGAGGIGGYAGGNASGGGIFNKGTLTLINSTVSGNVAIGGAGTTGFRGIAYSPAVLGPVAATSGGAGGSAYGGGIANSGGSVTIQAVGKSISLISGNVVKGGAGGAGGGGYNGLAGVNFSNPVSGPITATAGGNGGNAGNGGNGGNAQGGGISSTNGSVIITQSTISGNVASAGAGANGATGGAGGKGGNGGVIPASGGIPANTYYGYAGGNGGNGGNGGSAGLAQGGGIFSIDSLTIQASTLFGNVAKALPSGVFGKGGLAGAHGTHYLGTASPPTNGISGNAATISTSAGGGVYSGNGSLAVTISTIAANSAQNGGGVSISNPTSASLYNSTIALNAATISGGGGLFIPATSAGSVNIVSSIIAQNSGGNIAGTPGGNLSDNITSGIVLYPALADHAGGTTATLLPIPHTLTFANGPASNPDGLLTDQNGISLGATILPGAVQTVL
jgi:hypothetical protein